MNRKKKKDEELDILLEKAFGEYVLSEDKTFPSDEELREAFPPNEEDCLKYVHLMKKKKRVSAVFKVLRRVAVIVLILISASSAALMLNKNVRAAVTGTVYRFVDDYVWVRFSPGSGNSVFDGKTISDLSVGYVPEGLILCDSADAEYDETLGYQFRFFVICDPADVTAPGEPGYTRPPFVIIYVREGNQETGYSDEALAISKETTVNGMAALMFDFFFESEGEQYESTRLEFGDKNFTVYMQGMNVSGEDILKIAESLG